MSDLKDYVDLKADELKLRTTKGLSLAMGRLVAMLLLANLLIVVLALLAVVLIHWIGEWTGSLAIASSIVCGIFLILLIVLVAKGCGSRKQRAAQTPIPVQPQGQLVDSPAPPEDDYTRVAPPPQSVEEEEGRRLLREGQEYYNGDGGRLQSYVEAEKCFIEAKKLGVKDADVWLKKCSQKLAKPAASAPAPQPAVKPAPKPAPKKAVKPAAKPAPKKAAKPAAKKSAKPAPKKAPANPAKTGNTKK